MTSSPRAAQSRSSRFSKFVALAIAVLCCVTPVAAQTFLSFDAPGAGTGLNQGTFAGSINDNGAVTGFYVDSAGLQHGYVRSGSGSFTEFDAPNLAGTSPVAINSRGQVVGSGTRTTGGQVHNHGFLRSASGAFVPINVPGSSDTQPSGINDAGTVAGSYSDSQNNWHGFIRDASGNYTTFDVPGSGIQSGLGTFVAGINANGMVTGRYYDNAQSLILAYIRDQFGNFTTFAAGTKGTVGVAINLSGEVAGTYFDNVGWGTHGFVRDTRGNISSFDPLGSQGTLPYSMNDIGYVVGEWISGPDAARSFLRNQFGGIITFSASGPDTTVAASINNVGVGVMTGTYYDNDKNMVAHGFVK